MPATTPDQYCVLGNPIAHSRSPQIHSRFAALTGQQLHYSARLVPLDGFAACIADLAAQGVRGCNVTVPFKHQALACADRVSPRAARAGAANTLVFDGGTILADNTDGLGLVADVIRNADRAIAGRDLLLIGAGGAAAGALGPLLEQAPRRIVVANRTQARAQALVQAHADLAGQHGTALIASELHALAQDFDIVINATSSSLAGDGVPVRAQVLRPGALAYDMMYGAAAHGFLTWARAAGAQARDGLGMLVEQAAEAFALWRGVRPPAAQVLAELRAALDAPAP